jgi:apolipoprotein N-acyltransferase
VTNLPARLATHLRARTGWRAHATAFGLGVLATAALPPFHLVPLLWVAIPGLLLLIDAAPSTRAALSRTLAFGIGHHATGLFWITEALLIEAERAWPLIPVAVPAMAAGLSLFLLPAAWGARAVPSGWPRLLAFAGLWSLGELARGVVLTGFPWNLVGTAWAFGAAPMQAAAFVGLHGLSLATILLAALPGLGRRGLAPAALLLAGGAALGIARLWTAEPPPQPVAVRIIQGNIAQGLKWDAALRARHFEHYLRLTAEAPDPEPGAIFVAIWPETASPYFLAEDPGARQAIADVLPQGGLLLAGSVRVERTPALAAFNSLVAVDRAADISATYDKAHLVPFGEYVPLRGILPLPTVVRSQVDFSPGPGPRTLALDGLPPFSPLICYEAIFPGRVVAPGPRPAWLVNISNDAWFGQASGPWQHLAAARFRAVEEGLPLVRATNTGISAVYDSRGRTVARLGLGVAGVVAAPLPAPSGPTLFSHTGMWLPWMLAISVSLGGLWRHLVAFQRMNLWKN